MTNTQRFTLLALLCCTLVLQSCDKQLDISSAKIATESPGLKARKFAQQHLSSQELEQFDWMAATDVKGSDGMIGILVRQKQTNTNVVELLYFAVKDGTIKSGLLHSFEYDHISKDAIPTRVNSANIANGQRAGLRLDSLRPKDHLAGGIRANTKRKSLVAPGGTLPLITIVGTYSDGSAGGIQPVGPVTYFLAVGGFYVSSGADGGGNVGLDPSLHSAYLDPLYVPSVGAGLPNMFTLFDYRFTEGGILLTRNNYPGMSEGFPWAWWEDEDWLSDPNNFTFDMDQDQDGVYQQLNPQELALVRLYPTHAYIIRNNAAKAQEETIDRFGVNGLNDLSDAFRHAFFNAINRRDLGRDPATLQDIAKKFADAHESNVPPQLELEKQMDLWNNDVGNRIGADVIFPIFTSDESLAEKVMEKLIDGALRYLKPVEPTPPPGSNGINNDFWRIQGDASKARHGITNATRLTPSNQ